jgi:cytochrome c556
MKKPLIIIAVLLSVSSLVYAHSGATGVVKSRMDMMGDVAKSMKIIGQMIKGATAYDPDTAKSAALEIRAHSRMFGGLFPEGSTKHPSEALPVIWEDWEEFIQLFDQMEVASEKLSALVSTASKADELKFQFATLGKTCASCHEKFRLKK